MTDGVSSPVPLRLRMIIREISSSCLIVFNDRLYILDVVLNTSFPVAFLI